LKLSEEINLDRKQHSQLTLAGVITSLFFVALICGSSVAQTPAPSDDSHKGAAVFKSPKGYMATDKTELGPILFLHPKKPSAMFVTYPKKEETTDALRLRLRALAANMFLHDEATKANWEIKKIQSHPGDGDGVAEIATAKQGGTEVQVVIYERASGVRPFLYGYFAMRHTKGESDDARFIDENGKGVKEFDELWQSFPN
jgi:hypothetical protein